MREEGAGFCVSVSVCACVRQGQMFMSQKSVSQKVKMYLINGPYLCVRAHVYVT